MKWRRRFALYKINRENGMSKHEARRLARMVIKLSQKQKKNNK